ncbi:MAG: zinc ribbon domain-containing protein [Acidobacteria bacterium]|nr:zinc ribbon domain-containing protein [Acidobacteriota bacterium]
MPLYEYECEHCAHRFERIQKFSDPPLENCPKCDGPVRKLLSSPAIQFKGSGWYITDYARKPSGDQAAETKKEEAASTAERSADGSSDSKASDSKAPDKGKTESGTTDAKPTAATAT